MSDTSLSSLSDHEGTSTQRNRTRNNPPKFNADVYDEVAFKQRFRLNKTTVLNIVGLIRDKLQHSTKRNRAISAMDQVLIALRFFATGSYQRVVGDLFCIQQPTVHRIVHRVASAIAELKNIYIYMPREQEQQQVVSEFFNIAQFPRVIGAIDCTHIKIISPGGSSAELYRNRKGYFSLNVQMVCDAKLRIRNIIARWPGSVHDSTIFNDSPLCADFERGDFGNYHLLGDSGYPCRSYILTPLLNPSTPPENRYNRAQISTRNPVERLYGVLKHRFPCLQIGLGVKIEKVPAIIVACAVLHNIALASNDLPLEEEDAPPIHDIFENEPNNSNNNYFVRNTIIQTYFT